jgi:hypothetical protein
VAIEAGGDAERRVVLGVRGKPRRLAVPEGKDQDEGGEPREGGEEGDLETAHRNSVGRRAFYARGEPLESPWHPGGSEEGVDGPEPGEPRLLLTTWSDAEAALVAQLLEQAGIPCQVVSDVSHALFPLTVDGLGAVRILVPASRHDEAAARIAEHRRRGFEIVDGEIPDGNGEECT